MINPIFPENGTAQDILSFLTQFTSALDFTKDSDRAKYVAMWKTHFRNFNLHYKNPETHVFTKARKHEGLDVGKLFANKQQMLCAPPDKAKVSRCNLPGKPIFYCSPDPGTSVYEVRPKVGDWITTIELGFIAPTIKLLAIGMKEDITTIGPFSEKDRAIHLFFRQMFKNPIGENDSYLYYITALFVDKVLSDEDGILYRSVGSNDLGLNVALRKEFVDFFHLFRSATTLEVISISPENEINLKCIHNANEIDYKGDFIWEEVHDYKIQTVNKGIYE